MEIKKCPHCGRELPIEANFCPYCMTKLIDEKDSQIHHKNSRKVLKFMPLVLGIFVIACILIGVFIFVSNREDANKKKIAKTENYEDYLGIWYDDANKNLDSKVMENGQDIEIVNVDGKNITFNIENFVNQMYRAHLDYVTVQLKDGTGDFSFTNDGMGNAGQGTITLKNGKIHAKVTISQESEGGTCDLGMDTGFTRVVELKKNQSIDISDKIWDDIQYNKGYFGLRTDVERNGDEVTYVYENGVTVYINNVLLGFVNRIMVDYNNIKGAYNFNYKGIDHTYTKDKVAKKLGVKISKEDTTYLQKQKDGKWVMFFFDTEGYVNSILYDAG